MSLLAAEIDVWNKSTQDISTVFVRIKKKKIDDKVNSLERWACSLFRNFRLDRTLPPRYLWANRAEASLGSGRDQTQKFADVVEY